MIHCHSPWWHGTWVVQHSNLVLVPQRCHELQCNKGVFLFQYDPVCMQVQPTCWLDCQNHYIAIYCPYDSWSDFLLHCICQVQHDPSVCLFIAAGCQVTFTYGLYWEHTVLIIRLTVSTQQTTLARKARSSILFSGWQRHSFQFRVIAFFPSMSSYPFPFLLS